MPELGLYGAFLVGLLGGAHCAGMCGGIVGAFSCAGGGRAAPSLHLAYNAGRIASYSLAGAAAGALGQAGLLLRGALPLQQLMFALASLLLLGLGLQLAGAGAWLRHVEAAGALLWRRIQPYSRWLLPADTPLRALGLGALWGWLPCGMVYSVLVLALASGSVAHGAAIMLAFGLGTLPNLLAIGLLLSRVPAFGRGARIAAGTLIAGFGAYGLLRLALVALGADAPVHVHMH